MLDDDREIPAWIDEMFRKAVHPEPNRRYGELSEFLYDLRHPNQALMSKRIAPLLERNPGAFWRGVSLVLTAIIAVLLVKR